MSGRLLCMSGLIIWLVVVLSKVNKRAVERQLSSTSFPNFVVGPDTVPIEDRDRLRAELDAEIFTSLRGTPARCCGRVPS